MGWAGPLYPRALRAHRPLRTGEGPCGGVGGVAFALLSAAGRLLAALSPGAPLLGIKSMDQKRL